MKQIILTLSIALLGIVASCTQQKEDATLLSQKESEKPIITTEIDSIAPVFEYTQEEWNSPIDSCTLPIDINGLEVDKAYSLEELTRVFGDPAKSDDWERYGKYAWEDYGRWRAYFRTGHHTRYTFEYAKEVGIYEFLTYEPQFSIYNGMISVGKSIRLFKALGCGRLIGNLGVYTNQKEGTYRFFTCNDPGRNVFDISTDDKGIITFISFSAYPIIETYEDDEAP